MKLEDLEKQTKRMIVAQTIAIVISIVLLGAFVYAATHFILKYW